MATKTVLTVRRGSNLPIMQEIEEVCGRLNRDGNVASHASFAGTEMNVCFSPDGVQLTFNRRLANMPIELVDTKTVKVRIEVTMESDTPDGIYRRNGSVLIVEPGRYVPPPRKTITVEASTLRKANNLFQDFLDGKFPAR